MKRTLVIILALAVAVRLLAAFGYYRGLLHLVPTMDSTDGYFQVAENLHAGLGYRSGPGMPPDLQHSPGYPLLLAGIFALVGVRYDWVQVVQALLGALGCLILYGLGRWVHSTRLGLVMAALYAVYPNAVDYSARLFSENLYLVVFPGAVYLICRAALGGPRRLGFAAGAAWGLSMLTRSTLGLAPLALAAGLAFSRPHRAGGGWRLLLPALLGAALVVAPWTARNYRVSGRFVPVTAWAWWPSFQGIRSVQALMRGGDLMQADVAAAAELRAALVRREYGGDSARAAAAGTDYLAKERVARAMVLAEIRRDPLGAVTRTLYGIPTTWYMTYRPGLRALGLAVHLPLMVLFVLGVWRMRRRYPDAFTRALPALIVILFVNLLHAALYPQSRYMAPATALSFLYSGLMLIEGWDAWQARGTAARRATGGVAGAAS